MKRETLNAVKMRIEQLNKNNLKLVKAYLNIAKLFDSSQAISNLDKIIADDNYQVRDLRYYLINVYCMVKGYKRPGINEINQFEKLYSEEIESYCKRNFAKNYSVGTHSFNGGLKNTIQSEGLKSSRKDDGAMRRLYDLSNKYLSPFMCSNLNSNEIHYAKIPSNAVVEHATSSPEWMEQFLSSCFGVTYEEYANKDKAVITNRIEQVLQDLKRQIDTGKTKMTLDEYNEYRALTYKFVDMFVNSENPCFAIVNAEMKEQDVDGVLNSSLSKMFNYENMISNNATAVILNNDVPPSMLTVIELPFFRKKKISLKD